MRNKFSVIHFEEPQFFQQRFYAASFLQHSVDSRRAVTFVATLQLIELPTHTKQLSLLTAVFSIGIVRKGGSHYVKVRVLISILSHG